VTDPNADLTAEDLRLLCFKLEIGQHASIMQSGEMLEFVDRGLGWRPRRSRTHIYRKTALPHETHMKPKESWRLHKYPIGRFCLPQCTICTKVIHTWSY